MIPQLTPAGAIHTALAILCIVAGLIQFLGAKRGTGHRARGYFYVYGMLVTDGTALLVYRFTGHFNWFHVGAIINFICVMLAIVPLLRTPRPANWRLKHYYFISWSYVSLMSAAASEIAVRLLPLTNRGHIEMMALVLSIVMMAIGYVLIGKYRPLAEASSASARLVEQTGVTS